MQSDELKRRISAGRGDALADLVLRNARIVNVFTDEIDTADIAISGNSIVGVGTYHGRKEVDLHGKYVCPGLIDALWSGFRAGSAAPRYHCGGHRPTRDLERCGAGRLGFYAGNDKKSDPFGLFHAALLCSGHGSG